MVEVGLMIEGQDGLTWPRWQRLLAAAEDLGYPFVFRSDHLTNARPPDKPALELWSSLTYAAGHTNRIEFGPLVLPITFQLPAIAAWSALAVENLSDGRLVLGIGLGWQEREHQMFDIPFPPTAVRYQMLQEYLEVVIRLLRSAEPVSYDGKYYHLHNAVLLPRPARPGGPPILIGGNGRQRTMRLAARYADDWNGLFVTPAAYRDLNAWLDTLLAEAGRPRDAVRRSIMLGTLYARDEQGLRDKLGARGQTVQEAMEQGLVVGTPHMWVDQLRAFAAAGAQRIMLQWLDLDNIADLETIAREVLPAL